MKELTLEERVKKLESAVDAMCLESRVAKLERAIHNETQRVYFEWEPNMDKAKEIVTKILANPDVNPDGLTLKDFNVDTYPSTGAIIVHYGDANVDFDAPSAENILNKYKSYKTYDVKSGNFKDQGYFSIGVNTKERKTKWYDPEFGSDFDRDEYMSNRRDAEWAKAQRDARGWM